MSNSSGNKRIAINTVYMYLRLFITMAIGLYTSRVVLLVLGVSNYGLFNVVGGVLAMFTFLQGSLSGATTRFLNVEMGKPDGDVNKSYNINLLLHIILAGIILVLSETIGLWYIYNRLNVEPEQIGNAVFIFEFSIISTCLGIIIGPCGSLFTAHEKYGFIAKFDVFNNLFRLAGVVMLQYYGGNVLRFYTLIMFMMTGNTVVVYYWVARKKWPDIIKLRFVKGWKHYKSIVSFGGWNLFSTLALMARSSGSDLLVNYFFNTSVNGAFAISKNVNTYIMTFSTNFDSASGPQIIQSYSNGEYSRVEYLANKLGKFCLLFFELVFFPLYIELNYILELWLKVVPPDVLVFCQWNLILAAVALSCGGIIQVINASGKIKWFRINLGVSFMMCIPLGYWIYAMGAPPHYILILFVIADVIQRIVQLIQMKLIIGFDSWRYVKDAYIRPLIIGIIMSAIIYGYSFLDIETPILKLVAIALSGLITALLVFYIGLSSGEREKVKFIIYSKFAKITGCQIKLFSVKDV